MQIIINDIITIILHIRAIIRVGMSSLSSYEGTQVGEQEIDELTENPEPERSITQEEPHPTLDLYITNMPHPLLRL